MADYYRQLLVSESDYLSERIAKYNKILDQESEQMNETVIGQIHLAIGQSNLFINERFKQFSGLIDDCELKRGEKETTVEDLGGFWDMIYYQVEDLKTKYAMLEQLEQNKWIPIETAAPADAPVPVKSLKTVMDNKSNINKNKRAVPSSAKTSPPLKNGGSASNGISTTDGAAVTNGNKKPAGRSNFREFLKNKRKEVNGNENGSSVAATNGNSTTTATHVTIINIPATNGGGGLTNGTHLHLNGSNKQSNNNNNQQEAVNGTNNNTTNGHHTMTNGDSIESQKLKALTETMSRHSLTTSSLRDETNKEN